MLDKQEKEWLFTIPFSYTLLKIAAFELLYKQQSITHKLPKVMKGLFQDLNA